LAISRARKEELVAEYQQQLTKSSGFIMANYSALTVQQMQDLRRRARERDGEIFVVKNTLLTLVLKAQGIALPKDLLIKPVIVVFCHKDVPPLVQLFRDYTKEVDEARFKIKGGLVEGQLLSAAEALAFADMPSRDVLLAKVLGTINAPATQMVGVVAGGIRQVVNVVQAYADKLEQAGNIPAEAAA